MQARHYKPEMDLGAKNRFEHVCTLAATRRPASPGATALYSRFKSTLKDNILQIAVIFTTKPTVGTPNSQDSQDSTDSGLESLLESLGVLGVWEVLEVLGSGEILVSGESGEF